MPSQKSRKPAVDWRRPRDIDSTDHISDGLCPAGKWNAAPCTMVDGLPPCLWNSLCLSTAPSMWDRYEGPNNTDYRPGNTYDRLTADP